MATQEQVNLWNRFISANKAEEGRIYEVRTSISPFNNLVCVGNLVSKENVRLLADEGKPYITYCVGKVHIKVGEEVKVFDLPIHELYLPPRDEPVHRTTSVLPNDLE